MNLGNSFRGFRNPDAVVGGAMQRVGDAYALGSVFRWRRAHLYWAPGVGNPSHINLLHLSVPHFFLIEPPPRARINLPALLLRRLEGFPGSVRLIGRLLTNGDG